MSDARVDFADILDSFGVPATVKRKDEAPIVTVGVIVPPSMEQVANGLVSARHRLIAFSRDAWVTPSAIGDFEAGATVPGVTKLPEHTRIVAPERLGDADKGWIVDGPDVSDADHVRRLILPDREYIAEPDVT